jgi:transposase
LLRDQGWTARAIPEAVDISLATVHRVCRRYKDGGLKRALHDKQRPGVPKRLTPGQEAQIVALVCSQPPTGYARWTIARLTMEVQARQIAPQVSRETIRLVLKRVQILNCTATPPSALRREYA